MAELMRKFFEMNDTDVLIVMVLYFGSVTAGWIYCCKQWKKEEKGVKSEDKNRRKKRNTMDRR